MTGPIAVGDELVVRIELRVDRNMEYVHLKDQRGSGTEPVNVLSRYKYQGGLAYYESTRDTASHFLIDYLPKGMNTQDYQAVLAKEPPTLGGKTYEPQPCLRGRKPGRVLRIPALAGAAIQALPWRPLGAVW